MRRINTTTIGCLLACWCLLAAASSCTLSEVEDPARTTSGETMELPFSLTVAPAGGPDTRAPGLDESKETTIGNLCFVQFDATGMQLGKPTYQASPVFATNTGGVPTIDLELERNVNTNTVYLLANAGNQIAAISGCSEARFKELTLAASAVINPATGTPADSTCVMIGAWTGKLSDPQKNIMLTRALARIDFSYSISDSAKEFSFTLNTLKLCNVPGRLAYTCPEGQLADPSYTTYTASVPASNPSAESWCWYLPENRAGTASLEGLAEGDTLATTEKDKLGVGVQHATYIELTGEAVQNSITYPGVVFRIYPGSLDSIQPGACNDYNVNRNSRHRIHINFAGIDFSDKRITVPLDGSMADPTQLAAGIGNRTTLKILAKPGQNWSISLPNWLSALVNGTTPVPLLGTVSYHGSAEIAFITTTVNPTDTVRIFPFTIGETELKVRQDAAVAVGTPVRVEALPAEGTTSTFTATPGLPYLATVPGEADSWITLIATPGSPITSGTTDGSAQSVGFNTLLNPLGAVRTGTISVRVGDIVAGPVAPIVVSQAASEFKTSNSNPVVPTKGNPTAVTIHASDGLPWTIAYTSGSTAITTTATNPDSAFSGTREILFSAPANTATSSLNAYFKVTVAGLTPERSFSISVRQEPVPPVGSFYGYLQLALNTSRIRANWHEAIAACASYSEGGFGRGSWRLPTASDHAYAMFNRTFCHYTYQFPIAGDGSDYWVSDEANTDEAYYVRPNGGTASNSSIGKKTTIHSSKCVRTIP